MTRPSLPRRLPDNAGLLRTAHGMLTDPYYRGTPPLLMLTFILQQRSYREHTAWARCPHPTHSRAARRWLAVQRPLDRFVQRRARRGNA